MDNNFWVELLKLGIFSVFVTAVLEVLKDIYLRFKPSGIKPQTVKIINFALALYLCYIFDYGVMSRIIQMGSKLRESQAGFVDYFCTASVVYMGAGAVFDKFSSLKSTWLKAKDAVPLEEKKP